MNRTGTKFLVPFPMTAAPLLQGRRRDARRRRMSRPATPPAESKPEIMVKSAARPREAEVQVSHPAVFRRINPAQGLGRVGQDYPTPKLTDRSWGLA